MRLLLASASPRRADLLRSAGFAFDVLRVDIDERPLAGEVAADYVRRLAMEKSARALELVAAGTAATASVPQTPEPAGAHQRFVVLAADTTVVIDGTIVGKPADAKEAADILRRLSGRRHEVMTGLSLREGGRESGTVETTDVDFVQLSEGDIDWYVASREWTDKAGGYAIQGLASRFVRGVRGSYSNVVGLPVAALAQLLAEIASGVHSGYSER